MRALLYRWPVFAALVMLPVFILFLIQGVISLYSDGPFTASLVVAAVALLLSASLAGWLYWRNRGSAAAERERVDMVEADPAWGPRQEKAWLSACSFIDDVLESNDQIQDLPLHSLAVVREVAAVWNKSGKHLEYAITLPEGLLAAETLTARYRKVLLENIPFSNTLRISQALSLWEMYEKHEKALNYSHKAYRFYRFFSVSGVMSELGSLAFTNLSDGAKENLIYNLKRAYLQEVANVAIDLYSGTFRKAIDELPAVRDTQLDIDNLAGQVGPVRIMIVGQISSGKSSLTNAILEEFRAEAGLVPTTAEERVYQFSISDGFDTSLIDTPGIESGPAGVKQALERLKKADLVIWVMRANQPGRSIDKALFDAFNSYFDSNPDRQRPAVLVAATHVDCIPSFAGVDEQALVKVTQPLADACRKAVKYDAFSPLSLTRPEQGLAGFRQVLGEYYERAVNTRLNRLRVNQPSFFESASDELARLKSGSVEAVQLIVRRKKGNELERKTRPLK